MADMSAKEFFDKFIPEKLASLSGVDFPDVKDTIQIEVIGAGEWTGKIEGGKPTITAGKASDPLITVAFTEAALKMGLARAGDQLDADISGPAKMAAGMLSPDKAEQVRSQLQGTMKFTITTNDGKEESIAIGFNGIDIDTPTCTIKTTEGEMNEMREQQMPPQQAFMAGKIRLEGDMSLAMQAGMLFAT
ncbi:MAG: SCP2 sterol-binding domain-containing protein [Chrysiogenetes bacterium]|nr:SCP2 sterol-binding domain-containing protein [Chrysiogenetes bacterium]